MHGNTLIETVEGRRKIKDLVGQDDVRVWSGGSGVPRQSVASDIRAGDNVPMVAVQIPGPATAYNKNPPPIMLVMPSTGEVMMADKTYKAASALIPGTDRVTVFRPMSDGWWQAPVKSVTHVGTEVDFDFVSTPDGNCVANSVVIRTRMVVIPDEPTGT